MLRTLQLLLLFAFAAAISAAGCGGSSDPLTAAQLVAQGDRICATEQERFDEVQATPPADGDEAASQSGDLADAASDELGDLEDLTPPAELKTAFESYLDSLRAARDLLEKGESAASDQSARDYGATQSELAAGAARREKLAREIGFKTCSAL